MHGAVGRPDLPACLLSLLQQHLQYALVMLHEARQESCGLDSHRCMANTRALQAHNKAVLGLVQQLLLTASQAGLCAHL